MPGWKTLSSEEVYKTPWIRVRRDEVLNHRGKPLTYSVVELNHPSVVIIATDGQDRMLLQRMYRHTTGTTGWEIPAGHSDGEEPLVAAKRELAEEAGLASDDWSELGTFYEANGIGDIPIIYFLAENVHEIAGGREDVEDISDWQFISSARIASLVRNGEINDATVLVAQQLLTIHHKKGGA